ncbi:MAG: hypothetical protein LBC74_09645 [Planctomycetaceae bacterium]|nr:hypothetical protein [Planctomycetaceae bacterium]
MPPKEGNKKTPPKEANNSPPSEGSGVVSYRLAKRSNPESCLLFLSQPFSKLRCPFVFCAAKKCSIQQRTQNIYAIAKTL